MPTAGRGEVRVRVLASGLEYTDVLIRRHLYPQTMRRSFGERKLYRICWQTIFVSEIRQAVDTVRICLVSRTFLTATGAASHARLVVVGGPAWGATVTPDAALGNTWRITATSSVA